MALRQGIALVDSYMLLTSNRYPELTFRPFRPQIVTSTSVIHLKSRSLGTITQLFLEELREIFKKMEDREGQSQFLVDDRGEQEIALCLQ